MSLSLPTPLVSCKWVNDHLSDPDLILLDASFSTGANLNTALRIPNSRFFDIKSAFSDVKSPYPNMLCSVEQFQTESQLLGINAHSKLVVYDDKGIYSAARAWWMLTAMGHQQVAVLDGGLVEWKRLGYSIEELKKDAPNQGDFIPQLNPTAFRNFEQIQTNLGQPDSLVIDCRSAGRFEGTAPEPREGLRSGSIPDSLNIHYALMLDDHQRFKSVPELKAIFEQALSGSKPLIFSCGSGVTACIVLLAHQLVYGNQGQAVYDGSWTEWAMRT